MTSSKKQISFLISLPRSGSTWVQREICSLSNIDSTPETWIALPIIYSYLKTPGYTEYSGEIAHRAIRDFYKTREISHKSLNNAIREFLDNLYFKGEDKHFLEKTPRYSLILDELGEIYPCSKFIILYRNPADIAFSMLEAWGYGWIPLYRYEIDFLKGWENMNSACKNHQLKTIKIKYEEITDDKIKQLIKSLGENYRIKKRETVFLQSEIIGDQKYKTPTSPQKKHGLIARIMVRNLIRKIPKESLEYAGYTQEDIEKSIKNKTSNIIYIKELISAISFPILKKTNQIKLLSLINKNKEKYLKLNKYEIE